MFLCKRGLRLTIRSGGHRKPPMTIPHLVRLVEYCEKHAKFLVLSVALVVGFLAFLRASNLAPPSPRLFDKDRHTTMGDVRITPDGVLVYIKWTKTFQEAGEQITIPLPEIPNSKLCPKAILLKYMQSFERRRITERTPLLLSTGTPRGQVIGLPTLRSLFRQALSATQLSPEGYTLHSLRRGGATESYRAGVPLDHVKQHGTWRSDAVLRYISTQTIASSQVAQTLKSLILR